jgi:hypothetical protein
MRSTVPSAQSSRLAEFGGLGMSFNMCFGTLGSLAMFTANAYNSAVKVMGASRRNEHGAAPVYGWFTEGFDTLDLKETKALLKRLAG